MIVTTPVLKMDENLNSLLLQESTRLQFDQNMGGHKDNLLEGFQYREDSLHVSYRFPHQRICLDTQQDSKDE
jgi:hypothetical protein